MFSWQPSLLVWLATGTLLRFRPRGVVRRFPFPHSDQTLLSNPVPLSTLSQPAATRQIGAGMMVSQAHKNWGFVWDNSPEKETLGTELASTTLVPNSAKPFSFEGQQATSTLTQFLVVFRRSLYVACRTAPPDGIGWVLVHYFACSRGSTAPDPCSEPVLSHGLSPGHPSPQCSSLLSFGHAPIHPAVDLPASRCLFTILAVT